MSKNTCELSVFETDKSAIIKILKHALDNVTNDYIKVKYSNVNAHNGNQKPERVFVAELYHQLRMFQEECDCKNRRSKLKRLAILNNLTFNVEPLKQRRLAIGDEINNYYNFKRVIPDLILHHSQNDKKSKNQQLVCEVKSSYYITIENFKKDLAKLFLFKSRRFNYQNACFIFLGTKEELCRYLSVLDKEYIDRINSEKIIFITRDNNKWNFYEYK